MEDDTTGDEVTLGGDMAVGAVSVGDADEDGDG
jgi:hypothetical protein